MDRIDSEGNKVVDVLFLSVLITEIQGRQKKTCNSVSEGLEELRGRAMPKK